MRRVVLIAAAALGSALVTAAVAQQIASSGPDVNRGRFVTYGGLINRENVPCVQCHGADGVGGASGAIPKLAGQNGWYLYKSLQDYAAGVRPNEIMMPIARELSADDMQDVSAYYASLAEPAYPVRPRVDAQTLQVGGAIAAVGIPDQGVPACSGCHGEHGVSTQAIYPDLAGQHAPYTAYQLLLWKAGKRDGDPMNIMKMIAKSMTEEQIEAVALYYASVQPVAAAAHDAPPALAADPLPPADRTYPDPGAPETGAGILPPLEPDASAIGAAPPYLPPGEGEAVGRDRERLVPSNESP